MRAKLWQPWMVYNSGENIEYNLGFTATSREDHFNDVYQIQENGTKVTYTCPPGWVFENSFNITQTAYCENGTWRADFDPMSRCIRKFKYFENKSLIKNFAYISELLYIFQLLFAMKPLFQALAKTLVLELPTWRKWRKNIQISGTLMGEGT